MEPTIQNSLVSASAPRLGARFGIVSPDLILFPPAIENRLPSQDGGGTCEDSLDATLQVILIPQTLAKLAMGCMLCLDWRRLP